MKKKIIALCLVVALAVIAIGGATLAYFSDTDSAKNEMTLGSVDIEQKEYQWNDSKTGLVAFKQDKPLMPYVGTLGWENDQANGGAYRRFTMENVVDKYVSVKNIGKSPAYVRTVFAFEMGEFSTVDDFYYKVVGTSINAADGSQFQFSGAWIWGNKFVAQIDGHNYMIWEAVHQDALKPEGKTIPSLLQVYMNAAATNEDCEKLDGNNNDKYDILVLSQAVQAAGFETVGASEALDEAFGDVTAAKATEWFTPIANPAP
jgi:predicted ribosomally synthesized peptide with SipW-like signal peptide